MRRWLWADAASAEYARGALNLPGLRVLPRVDREVRYADGSREGETRYFVTRPGPDCVTAGELLRRVRGRWGVGNDLHFIKDRWRDEGRHDTARPGLAERLAVPRNAALTVPEATADPEDQTPLRGRADELGWHLDQTLNGFATGNL